VSEPRPERWRVFVAVAVPPRIRERIERAIRPMRDDPGNADVRWTRPEGYHFTVRFIGSVEPGRIPEIEAAIGEAARAQPPFEVRFGNTGTFGGTRRPRVAWLGLWDGSHALGSLELDLSGRLAHLEHRPRFGGTANRPVAPHVTIARAVPDGFEHELYQRLQDLQGTGWTVRELLLYRSHLGPGGSRYQVLSVTELSV
jgi:2'-5' RNA ligase